MMIRQRTASVIVSIIFGSATTHNVTAEKSYLPPKFEGIWVTADSSNACAHIAGDDDVLGVGEGVLLLRGRKYYSHKARCVIQSVLPNCCDEKTISATYACGKYKGRVVLKLHDTPDNTLLIETVISEDPIVRVYTNRCD